MKRLLVISLAALLALAGVAAAPGESHAKPKPAAKPEESKSGDDKPFDQVVKDMEPVKGLFTFYRRAEDNKLILEIPPEQLDHVVPVPASVDRSAGERGFYASMMGTTSRSSSIASASRIQWIMKNTSFTAAAGTPEARTVDRSFPDAILASVKLLSKPHPDRKSLLIDAADLFATRDYSGFAGTLNSAYAPTTFTFDKDRTTLAGVQGVSRRTCIVDVALNFQTDNFRASTTTLADPRSVPIVRQVPAVVAAGRRATSRGSPTTGSGTSSSIKQDFSSDHDVDALRPLHPPLAASRSRTRLPRCRRPSSRSSTGSRTPFRSSTATTSATERCMWNKAFERIGFKDAVVVKQKPDSADWDPADVRYNTIRWFAGVDASFAIGPRRVNPFTGQIYRRGHRHQRRHRAQRPAVRRGVPGAVALGARRGGRAAGVEPCRRRAGPLRLRRRAGRPGGAGNGGARGARRAELRARDSG